MDVEDVYVNADSVVEVAGIDHTGVEDAGIEHTVVEDAGIENTGVEDAGIEHTVVVGKEDDQYNKQPQLTQTGTISF